MLAISFLGVWAVAFAAAAAALPGETLEVALLGGVGAVAIAEARAQAWSLSDVTVALFVLTIPLLGTWPGRKWEAAAGRVPAPLDALVSLHSLLLVAVVVVGGRSVLRRARIGRLPSTAASLLVAGAVAGALANGSVQSLADTWLAFVVPISVAFAAAAFTRDAARGWSLLGLVSLGVLVPVVVGIGAYLLSFGVPTSGADLVVAKEALFRPYLLQDATFGNVDHFGNIALALLPAATLGVAARSLSTRLRVASGLAAVGLTLVLVMVLSRAALVLGIAAAVAVLLLLAERGSRRPLVAPACVLVLLAVVFASPAVRASFGVSSAAPQTTARSTGGKHGPQPATSAAASVEMRTSAIRTGIRIADHHLPFGIGSGRYPEYDPVHTAPHSLLVLVFAEDGVLGAAGLLVLAAFVGFEAVRLLLRRDPLDDRVLLRAACIAGAGAFLVDAIVFGAPLALGQLNVWPLLLWLQVGVLVGLRATHD